MVQNIQSQILTIEELKSKDTKYTEKHKEVLEMFSEKAKKHLQYEHYIAIETSLLVYDFLKNNENPNLDYSSAIIPILKCVEDLLFQIFGIDYFKFVKHQIELKKEIDYNDLPRNFKYKNQEKLVDKVDIMEYGSIIYACCYMYKEKPIKNIFLEFLKDRGIKDNEKIAREFVDDLIYIKDNYRNYTAHRGRIRIYQAEDCLDYLLRTIKFINKFLEELYL